MPPRKLRRRSAAGRVKVDPQFVRDQFADIVEHTPELQHEDPRLLSLYMIPPATEEGRDGDR